MAPWIQPPSATLLKPAHQAVQGLSVGFLFVDKKVGG
jgi:hypothetical protein